MTESADQRRRLADALSTAAKHLRDRGWKYWARFSFFFFLGLVVAPTVEAHTDIVSLNYFIFQKVIFSWLSWRPLVPRFTKLILIKDDEFWRDRVSSQGRLRRDYLAHLVGLLDQANVAVIAIDFDQRLPKPDSLEIPADVKPATDTLIIAVLQAAKHRRVVLPKTIWWCKDDDETSGYCLENDIYQAYGICSSIDKQGVWQNPGTSTWRIDEPAKSNLTCGYIALGFEEWFVPRRLLLRDGSCIDSFALAVARAVDPYVDEVGADGYASYISGGTFKARHRIFTSRELLHDPRTLSKLSFGAVIIGGDWHKLGIGRGDFADRHRTPAEDLPGALMHAGYTEAILDEMVYTGFRVSLLSEVVFGLVTGLILAFFEKFWSWLITIVILGCSLFLVEILLIQETGVFFNGFVLFISLAVHSALELRLSWGAVA